MSTIAWIPKSDNERYVDRKIESISAGAFEKMPLNPSGGEITATTAMTNHWNIFLRIAENESIRLNPTPGAESSMTLIATKEDCAISPEIVKALSIPTSNLTVEGFFALLRSAKYDRYKFSSRGTGCRYWTKNVIDLLLNASHLQQGSEAQAATDALGYVWAEDGELAPSSQQSGMDIGNFYELQN